MTIKNLLVALLLVASSALATEIPLGRVRGLTHPNIPFPNGATCGANEAIQTIGPGGEAISCITIGGGQAVPGSDTYVLYNQGGVMGADQYFTWDYTNQILRLGIPSTPGLATLGGATLAQLTTLAPSDGTIAYCSDCAKSTDPCTASSTGSYAERINGAWVCFGTAGGGGSTVAPPDTAIQFDQAGVFGGSANLTFDYTNFRLRGQNLTSASDNTTNMLQLTGTLPTVPSALVSGFVLKATGAGSASQVIEGADIELLAGYTGSSRTEAAFTRNLSVGTGATLGLNNTAGPTANIGEFHSASASGAGIEIASMDQAINSTGYNIGSYGQSPSGVAATNIGVLGNASGSIEATGAANVAGYFTLNSTDTLSAAAGASYGLYVDGAALPSADGSRALNVVGTLPLSTNPGADNPVGASMTFTTNASNITQNYGLIVQLNGVSLGSASSATGALLGQNLLPSANGDLKLNNSGDNALINSGVWGYDSATTTGINVGVQGEAKGSTNQNFGSYFRSVGTAAGTNIGVLANSANSTEGTDFKNVAGYFTLGSTIISGANVSAGLIVDGNGADEIRGYNASTLNFKVDSAGVISSGGNAGLTQTISVRKGDDSGACNIVVTGGIVTSTTC